jgi:hypothetical protein
MDIGKAFSFPFEDDDWLTKLFLGAVVSIVPILNFAWGGYTVDILRNVIDGVPRPLPAWKVQSFRMLWQPPLQGSEYS